MGVLHRRAARTLPKISEPSTQSGPADVSAYRPFFLSGVFTVLTAGCFLGAIALLGIALSKDFRSMAWAPYLKAHANSQLFGWVGFFIMGFSLQQHAPAFARLPSFKRLAYTSLVLMASGIVLRFLAEPLIGVSYEPWFSIGMSSTALQLTAVLVFVYNIAVNKHRTGQPLPWQSIFIFTSLLWLLVVSFAEPFVFASTHSTDSQSNVLFTAKWMPVIRDAQFLGFVAMMIFGVALSKLHTCFDVRPAFRTVALTGFVVWNASLVAKMASWLVAFDAGLSAETRTLEFAAGFGLGIATVILVVALRVFEPAVQTHRSHKFVRAAFFWLVVAALLLALEPVHLSKTGDAFSHAYLGAIRHAVTVGFISQMIVGFGLHIVSRMNRLEESTLPHLWSVWVLLNIGNGLRVAFEIVTDYTPSAFLPMGLIGFVELTALLIWAHHITRPLLRNGLRRAFSVA